MTTSATVTKRRATIVAPPIEETSTSGSTVYGFPADKLYDTTSLPDFDTEFLPPEHVEAFVQALAAPDPLQSPTGTAPPGEDGSTSPGQRSGSNASSDHIHFTKRNSVASIGGNDDAPRPSSSSLFITAKNDWAPVYEKVVGPNGEQKSEKEEALQQSMYSWWARIRRRRRMLISKDQPQQQQQTTQSQSQSQSQSLRRRAAATAASAAAGKRARTKTGQASRTARASGTGRRTRDETREGYLYGLLKWPFLLGVFAWIIGLSIAYLLTRMYIAAYEQLVTWRGRREKLRRQLRKTNTYGNWVAAARSLDSYLGNDEWKEENQFAFYDWHTVRRVSDQLRRCREQAQTVEAEAGRGKEQEGPRAVADLRALLEACVKNNFAGVENRHLYSRTYYGTKNLVQNFEDEVAKSLQFLIETNQLEPPAKRAVFKRLHANYGRTALCLSGGASFAYYHFGVVKALLDQDLLPDVITGTSGGALVAALVATRTDAELRQLLVPALAGHIGACHEPLRVWLPRWWRTGARFDSVEWAKQCSWWTRGSMTFREAYERTGRILNVTCVPADPHSPTILCNYRTAPDCVIWSAVLASAAVPGILNPVVLMMKTPAGQLVPYSFGHKWKDGSLRTDIPIRALNLYFNVNFTIVSQVNPHVNLFFFSSRGSVGQPVTHRKGRGWRGGYLGSAFEEYLKQDLRKWLKLLRNLELLPRPLGQDWSQLWLQPFGGTITIWPKSVPADFVHILSDPDPPRLARMLHEGQQSAFPPLKFISNRLRVERLIERGRQEARAAAAVAASAWGPSATASGSGHPSFAIYQASSSLDSAPSEDEGVPNLYGPDHDPDRRHSGLGSTTATTSDDNLSYSTSSSSDEGPLGPYDEHDSSE